MYRWAVHTVGVVLAANLVTGIGYDSWIGLSIASLLLGILNTGLRPLLILLALPLVVLSLGLFTLFINAALVYAIGWLVTSFHVASFGAAFWAGLVISIVSHVADWLLGPPRPRPPPQRPPRDDGAGPIIDV